MKTKSPLLATLATALFAGGAVLAQESAVEVEITRLDVDDNVYTPYYRVETEQDHEPGAAQKWLKLNVEYTTSGGWINQLAVRHKALVTDHGSPDPVVLAEEVAYINVGPGDHTSSVYMHPNCVERYGVDASKIDHAVELLVDGQVVARRRTNKEAEGDWAHDPGIPVHNGHLLNASETPFWFINYDFREIIKRTPHPQRGVTHEGHGVGRLNPNGEKK